MPYFQIQTKSAGHIIHDLPGGRIMLFTAEPETMIAGEHSAGHKKIPGFPDFLI